MNRRHAHKGLTLVELLIVAAILVLILIVLVTYVFPSDDRRCRMEAQRLAAFLTAVSAQAEVSGSPARASIDINRKTALLELTKETASLTEKLWETGDQKREHEVRDPVLIDEVDTAIVARQKMGRAFIIFAGNKTEGGVVVLVLNEAVYSVVVPPGKGLVRVEEGRSRASKGGVANRPTLPSMTGYETKAVKSDFPVVGMPPSVPVTPRRPPATSNKKRKNPPKNRKGTEPAEIDTTPREPLEDMLGNSTDSNGFSGLGSSGSGSSKPSTSTSPTTPNSNQPNTNSGCPNGNCMPPPDGRTFRLDNATVTEPNELKVLLEPILNDLIANGKLLLLARLNRPSSWLIQGVRKGQGYGNSENFPSYRGEPAPIFCSQANCTTVLVPDTGENHGVTLFIRDPEIDEESDQCLYQTLSLVDVRVNIEVSLDSTAIIEIKGTIRESTARDYIVQDGSSLRDVLEDNGVAKNADSVGDGLPDSWEFAFFGYGNQVIFMDNPAANTDQRPPNCDETD